jgi:hypothetical protein
MPVSSTRFTIVSLWLQTGLPATRPESVRAPPPLALAGQQPHRVSAACPRTTINSRRGAVGAGFRGPAKLGEVTQLQCITVSDFLAHRERVQSAGAEASEMSIRASRARSYTVDDPEGHRWYFSEPL